MITEQLDIAETVAPRTAAAAAPISIGQFAAQLRSKPFRPHPWLAGAHKQTFAAALWPRSRRANESRFDEARYFEVEPGTKLLGYCRWQADPRNAPTVIFIHGLEGSTDSVYMRTMAAKAFAAGFNVVRLNQRNCGGTEHLTPTLYHSGMNGDFLAVIRELVERDGLQRIVLSGISMSGNMVLQLAGERADELPPELIGIVAVSPSVDLEACAAVSGKPENRFYRRQFVNSIKDRVRRKSKHFPDVFDLDGLNEVQFIKDFDRLYTAKHGGFADAQDYYDRCSSLPYIGKIRLPTLIIHAQDDPIVPFEPLTDPQVRDNPQVLLLATETGGHVGFVGASQPDEDRFWAENRVIQFCKLLAERAAR
jgi:predicted alpha/beta-fold hydrolase